MDDHVSSPSFGTRFTALSEEPASLQSRGGAGTPEQTQRLVRQSRHHFTGALEFTDTRVETTYPAGIRLLLISSFDLEEISI
jgi:hypothetical protein